MGLKSVGFELDLVQTVHTLFTRLVASACGSSVLENSFGPACMRLYPFPFGLSKSSSICWVMGFGNSGGRREAKWSEQEMTDNRISSRVNVEEVLQNLGVLVYVDPGFFVHSLFISRRGVQMGLVGIQTTFGGEHMSKLGLIDLGSRLSWRFPLPR